MVARAVALAPSEHRWAHSHPTLTLIGTGPWAAAAADSSVVLGLVAAEAAEEAAEAEAAAAEAEAEAALRWTR